MIIGKGTRIFLAVAERRIADDARTFMRENFEDGACIRENFLSIALR
jgi:hypothetical protein